MIAKWQKVDGSIGQRRNQAVLPAVARTYIRSSALRASCSEAAATFDASPIPTSEIDRESFRDRTPLTPEDRGPSRHRQPDATGVAHRRVPGKMLDKGLEVNYS